MASITSAYSSPKKMVSVLSACNTPGKSGKKVSCGDRFITNRSSMDYDASHYAMIKTKENAGELSDWDKSTQAACFTAAPEAKVLAYSQKPPAPPEGHMASVRAVFQQNAKIQRKKTARHIPTSSERVLDAPDFRDDYYLNLLSWHPQSSHLAVALGPTVYIWNSDNGDITKLMDLPGEDDYVSSVSWMSENNILAVGTSTNEVQLWNLEATKRIRTMHGHNSRVGSLAWNRNVLASGSRSGNIHLHDVRIQNHHIDTLQQHTQEVCGLEWSKNGVLASGGNDNIVNIWDQQANGSPRFTFTDHQAAVKALAWCPWQDNLLATGGGTADRSIKFWNTTSGQLVNSIQTDSQVCSLLWSKEHREIISSHGFSKNQLCIWKYPSMALVAELMGHTQRVLNMAMSPDGQTVVSAAGDETLRFWNCFASDSARKTAAVKNTKGGFAPSIQRSIR